MRVWDISFAHSSKYSWASRVAQVVKNLPVMQETQVWSLGQEYPMEKGMATHSNILPWRISRTEEPGRPQSMESQRVMTEWLTLSLSVNTSISQILVSKCHSPLKWLWAPWKNSWFQDWVRKRISWDWKIFCAKNKKILKEWYGYYKRMQGLFWNGSY